MLRSSLMLALIIICSIAPTTPSPADPFEHFRPLMSADSFVGTMGVDISLGMSEQETIEIAKAVKRLGVRIVRLPILQSDPPYEALVREFFAINPAVRTLAITNCKPPLGPYSRASIEPSDVTAFEAATGRHIAYLEAVNEPNNQHDPEWATDTLDCIAPLTDVDKLPLVAPALVLRLGGADQNKLGRLPSVSFANVHRYYSGRNPGTRGWGGTDECGVYGALSWAMCWSRENAPGKPVIVSETGWNSETEVDEATQAKYISRVFFVDAAAGVALTSIYAFVSYKDGDGFGGTGLLQTDFTPKPAYRAMQNITHVLADPGPAARLHDLVMSIDPLPSDDSGLRFCLLAKRNGVFDIALWQEVQSADPDHRGKRDASLRPQTVTLQFPQERPMTVYRWKDDGNAPSEKISATSTIKLDIGDNLTIVEVH